MKIFYNKKFVKKITCWIISSLICSMLFSCKGVKIVDSQVASIKDYKEGEIMLLLADEKNKYELRFGHDIWDLKSGDGTRFYSDLVIQNIKKFVDKILTINQMSEKYNVSISGKDSEKIEELANEYYQGLTDDDIAYMKTSIEDVRNMYTNFHKARLTIDHVTKNANIELSISEAKAVKIQYVQLDDYETAVSVSTKSQARNANFSYFVKQYSTAENQEMEKVVMRGDDFSNPFPEIYYLATGQISSVLEHDGKYYVFKCLDDYMEEETAQRKKDILKQLKENAFYEEYNLFEKDNAVRTNASYWDKIDLKGGEKCTVNNFYNLYYKYFPLENE